MDRAIYTFIRDSAQTSPRANQLRDNNRASGFLLIMGCQWIYASYPI